MLRTLLLRKKLEGYQAQMAELNQRTAELATREGELEAAMNEARTDEELRSVEELVTAFTEEQRAHQEAVNALQAEIDAVTEELRTLESQTPPPPAGNSQRSNAQTREERCVLTNMQIRAYGSMTAEQRSAFIAREDVKEFLTRFREMFPNGQRRSVTGAELLIPTVVLNLLRENIEDYSKLLRRVRFVQVAGRARMPIMGTYPEAVWTEACAALNELYFTINDVEVDGYKVGGFVSLCNATLEDTDGVLLAEIILGMGASIGIAADKSILFGTGVKMPLGIAARLAQTVQPSNYSENARPWVNLSASNVITIPSGSTNDYASSLEIPKQTMDAARNVLEGQPFPIDVGKFCKDRYFVYIAAFGAFTEISYQTSQDKKNLLGHQAYMLEGVKGLGALKSHRMKVEWDGNVLEEEFIFGMVTNTISVGGFKGLVTQSVALNDGEFEVLLIRNPRTPRDLSNIISYMFLKEEPNDYVFKFRAGHIRITSEEPVDWVLDGEFGGSRLEVEVENLKERIQILHSAERP